MTKSFKEFLVITVSAIVGMGAFSSMSRTFQKDEEPKDEAFTFESFDKNADDWTMKGLSEVESFEGVVLRIFDTQTLKNVTFNYDDYEFSMCQYDGYCVYGQVYKSDTFIGELDIYIDEEDLCTARYVEEESSVTVNGQTFEYANYIDLYLGEELKMHISGPETDDYFTFETQYLQYSYDPATRGVAFVKG